MLLKWEWETVIKPTPNTNLITVVVDDDGTQKKYIQWLNAFIIEGIFSPQSVIGFYYIETVHQSINSIKFICILSCKLTAFG